MSEKDDDWPEGEDQFSLRMLEEGDPHFSSIGRVAYAMACLESILDLFITDLIRGPVEPLQCLVAQIIGPGPRRRSIMSLARYRNVNKELLRKINRFTLDCRDLGEKRNRVVHDALFLSEKTGRTFKMIGTADQVLNFGWRETSDDKMLELATEISALTQRGRSLYFHMIFDIGTTEQKEILQRHDIDLRDHPLD